MPIWPASTTFEIFKGPLKISKVVEAGQRLLMHTIPNPFSVMGLPTTILSATKFENLPQI